MKRRMGWQKKLTILLSALIIHHPVLRPLDVVELAGLCSPEKDEPGGEADEEHEYDECDDGPEHALKLQNSNPVSFAAKCTEVTKKVSNL